MSHLRLLIVGLLVFWLLLSGYWDNLLLLSLGAVSVGVVAYMDWRIERVYPLKSVLKIMSQLPSYMLWLFVEVIKANLDVLKRIWFPGRFPIAPVLEWVPMTQQTRLGKTIYANSVTLTPGTVSVRVLEDSQLLVHALSGEAMDELKTGAMDLRVSKLERPA